MDLFRATALLLVFVVYPFGFAVAQDASLETVLTTWGEAARKVDTIEADMTRWRYNHVMRNVTIQRGRFYLKAPNQGRYELDATEQFDATSVSSSGRPYHVASAFSELLVWSADRTFLIEPERKSYSAWRNSELSQARTRFNELPENTNALQRFFQELFLLAALSVANPEELLPLLVTHDPTKLKDRFELTVTQGDNVSITAVPKRPEDQVRFERITVLMDPKTNLPFASRILDPSGHTETVHLLKNIRLNQHAGDALLKPRLDGLRQLNEGDERGTVKQE